MSDTLRYRPERKRLALLAFKLTVSLILIGFVLKSIDRSLLLQSFSGIRASHLALAALILVCGGIAGALSWYSVIRAGGIDVPFSRILAMHWCGMFFNSFLPSNIGGDFYKGWMLVRERDTRISPVAAGIIVDRVLNFSLLILTGLAALALARGAHALAAAAVMAGASALAAAFMGARAGRCAEGGGRLTLFICSLFQLFREPRRCLLALCAAALSQGCKIGCHIFLVTAMGLAIEASSVWYVIPLFGVVSALPISLGGLGVREGVAISIAGPAGVVAEDLVVLSLAGHALFILVNSFGILPLLIRGRTRSLRS